MQIEKYIFSAFINNVIKERNIKMQVNSVNSTIFGAKIMPSEYLNKAIDLAKADVANGTKDGIQRAETFYNSLRTIESDSNVKELSINDNDKKLPPILSLDGTRRFVELYKNAENITGRAVQEAINFMAISKYFRNEMKNEAANVNLLKAFDKWIV